MPAESNHGDAEPTRDALPIVDAHHHLWDYATDLHYPWHEGGVHTFLSDDISAICRTYMPPEYRRDTALHNVVATVHVEAECDRGQQVRETEWLTEVNARYGMPNAIVAHAWVDTPDAEEVLAAHCEFPLVRGIRTKPITAAHPGESVRGEPRSMQDPKWLEGIGLLEKYGLSWDLRVTWWHLEEAAEVARAHPGLRIVLNHTGYPLHRDSESIDRWLTGMQALAACPNVWCKLSGLTVKNEPWTIASNGPIILKAIETFGVDRCMFASNYPVDGIKGSWDYFYCGFKRTVAHLPRADQEKLFASNATTFYRIDV